MSALDDARLRWLKGRDKYEAFGTVVAAEMQSAVRGLGLWCDTASRAKDLASLIKKLIRKPSHTYDSLPDKVGARCIIRYRGDLPRVVGLAQSRFACGPVDSKVDGLGVDQVGYMSIHIDVSLLDTHPRFEDFKGLHAELQIRTLAQHLWSEMSHDTVYKNETVFSRLPDALRRRVNLMAGIIEVADMEFNRLNGELEDRPEVQIYKGLETHFFRLTTRSPDITLSLDVIALLLPLYEGASIPAIELRVNEYVSEHEGGLHSIYAQQEEHPTSELVFQPEALMIAELLEHDEPTALRTLWGTKFPEAELERLALVFGHSFD